MVAEISLRDPVDFILWATGAAVWTFVVMVVLGFLAAATWQAIRATWSVGRQLWRVWRGAPRNPNVTAREAWWFAFWHEGLLR